MLPCRLKFILDRDVTIANLLDKAVEACPDRTLFATDEGLGHYGLDAGGITANELRRTINRLSNLHRAVGVGAFERLAVWKANSLDYLLHSWAAMRLGGIAVPVNGGMPAEEFLRYADHCGCAALVTDAEGLRRLAGREPPAALRTIFVTAEARGAAAERLGHARVVKVSGALLSQGDDFDAPHMDHDQDVLICHTSGTTGFPKGVLHGSRSLVLAARAQLRVQFISTSNVAMTAAWNNHHIALSGGFTSVMAA